jgi:hypothetical protein
METSTKAVLSLIVLVCGVGIGIAGKRLKRDDTFVFVFLMLLTLVPVVWIPKSARDGLLCAGIALFFISIGDSFWDRVGWAVGVAGPLYALSWVIPGGASVLIIGLTLIALWFAFNDSRRHLKRLRRAERLDPATRNEKEVEIGGTVLPARISSTLPGVDLRHAGGWRLYANGEKFCEPEHVVLTTAQGSVLVALASIDLDRVRLETAKPDVVDVWREQLGLEASETPLLQVVDADKEVYVIGTPTWIRAPAGSGGYRDSPLVPVFGKGSSLVQLPEAEVDARTWWTLILAIGFAIAATSVGVAQVLVGYV